MPRIFVSYRRSDSAGHTGRLYDSLAAEFGEANVFLDVTAIDAGSDFVERIQSSVAECDVLIAVIGDEWLAGEPRRIDDPEDFVHLEIAAGLEQDVIVIPVLVDGAPMPGATDLPERLKPLARRSALELSDSRWSHDVGRLLASIRKLTGTAATPAPRSFPWRIAASLAVVAVLAIVAVLVLSGGDGGSEDGSPTKAAWISQADQICAQTAEDLTAAGRGLDFNDQQVSDEFVADVIVPTTQRQLDQIDELVPPEGDEDEIDAILAAFRRGLDQLAADPTAAAGAYDEAFQLAEDYGLRTCSKGS